MKRAVLIASLTFSGAVHAALVPEHLHEMPVLAVAFIPAAAASLGIALALAMRPMSTSLPRLAVKLLALEIVVYLCVIAAGAESVEKIAVLCKIVEIVGLASALRLSGRLRRPANVAMIAGGLLGVSATAALAMPVSMPMAAPLPEHSIAIPGRAYEPPQLVAVTGQTITWHNLDSTSHTVTADDGAFDSGQIASEGSYSWTPTSPGKYAYHCSIHRFMHGEIDVYDLALAGPSHPIAAGSLFSLHGIAQTSGAEITLTDATGGIVATTTSAKDGTFTFPLTATAPTEYRASTGTAVSPTYSVTIAARPILTLLVHRGRQYQFKATTEPAQPGATISLEQYVPELFSWRPLLRQRLNLNSESTFSLRARRGLHLRLAVIVPVDGYHGGVSHSLRLP